MRSRLFVTIAAGLLASTAAFAQGTQTQTAPGGAPGGQQQPSATPGGDKPRPGADTRTQDRPGSTTQTQDRDRTQQQTQDRPGATQDKPGATQQTQDRDRTQTQDKDRRETTQDRDRTTTDRDRRETTQDRDRTTTDRDRTTTTQDTGETNVQVSSEQRTKIRETIVKTNVKRVTNVNFDIRVGVSVPQTVELVPIPTEVVEIVPQYRGYYVILVGDQILIIEPSSRRIVTVISA